MWSALVSFGQSVDEHRLMSLRIIAVGIDKVSRNFQFRFADVSKISWHTLSDSLIMLRTRSSDSATITNRICCQLIHSTDIKAKLQRRQFIQICWNLFHNSQRPSSEIYGSTWHRERFAEIYDSESLISLVNSRVYGKQQQIHIWRIVAQVSRPI